MAYSIDSKKIAKNTIALYFRMGITMIISFFTARVTLQQLGVEDYGLNNLVGSIVSMFTFLNGSMGTAVQRFYSYEIGQGKQERLSRIFGVGLYLHFLIAVFTVILAEIFALFYLSKLNIPEARMYAAHVVFQISIVSLALNILNVPYAALLRAREMFSQTAVIDIIQSLLRLGVLYLLITIDYDKLIVLSLLNLGITVFHVGALTYLARQFSEARSWMCTDKGLIKKMFSFISFLIITVLAQLAKTQGLVILVNLFFGLVVNAAYAIAVQVSNIVNTFVLNFKQSMIPQIMASYGAGDLNAMHKLINTGTKLTFLLMLLISLPVIFSGKLLLELWLGEIPEHTVLLVSLVLVYINISSFTYFHYQGVHATGKIKNQQIWMSFLYVANILLIYVLFKIGLSFEWALYANMIISFLQCLINLYYAKIRYNYNIKNFLYTILFPALAITLILIAVMYLIYESINKDLIQFISIVFVDILLVGLLGYFLLLTKEERIKIKSMIIKKR